MANENFKYIIEYKNKAEGIDVFIELTPEEFKENKEVCETLKALQDAVLKAKGIE